MTTAVWRKTTPMEQEPSTHLLAVGIAIQAAYHGAHINWPFVGLAASGLIIVCALWWLYFT